MPGDQSARDGTITYSAGEDASFACKLDTQPTFTPCPQAGYSFTGLDAGSHTLVVHASDAFANTGPDATYSWMVLGTVNVRVIDGAFAATGVTVLAQDAAGATVGSATTDGNGTATLVVPTGGMVTATISKPSPSGGSEFTTTVTAVEPFDDLVLGIPPPELTTTFTVVRTLPPASDGAGCYRDVFGDGNAVACNSYQATVSTPLGADALDATGKVNLLVEAAASASGGALAFAWETGINANSAVSLAQWNPLPAVPRTVNLTSIPGTATSVFVNGGISFNGRAYGYFHPNTFALDPPPTQSFTLQMPPAGIGDGSWFLVGLVTGGTIQYTITAATDVDLATSVPIPAGLAVTRDAQGQLAVAWTNVAGLTATDGVLATLSGTSRGRARRSAGPSQDRRSRRSPCLPRRSRGSATGRT